MGSTVSVDVVRVFTTEEGIGGNELGLISSEPATSGIEQRIAAELGFSETVFVDHMDRSARRAAIRIFTPQAELPFAGHPSVGAAWWLADRGTPVDVLAEPAGAVSVQGPTRDSDLVWIAAQAAWTPEFEFRLEASVEDVLAIDAQSQTGLMYSYAWIDEAAGRLRSRSFPRDLGIVEDEATGAAAVRLTSVLERDLNIVQGHGSQLFTRFAPEANLLGGRVVRDRDLRLELDR